MNTLAALLIADAVRTRIEQDDCPTAEQQPRETVEEALCELQRMIAADLVSREYVSLKRQRDKLRAALECESAIEDMSFDEGNAVLKKHGWLNDGEQTATAFVKAVRRAALSANPLTSATGEK